MIYGQYRFCCRFKDEAMLPEYKGSTFRGVFGGLVGTSSYADVPGYFRPIIELAEKLHIGKQTTFGLGKFHAST